MTERWALRLVCRVVGLLAIRWYVPRLSHDVIALWYYLRPLPGLLTLRRFLLETAPGLLPDVVGLLLGSYLRFGGRALLNRLEPAGFPRCLEWGYKLTGLMQPRRCAECGSPIPDKLRSEQGPPS